LSESPEQKRVQHEWSAPANEQRLDTSSARLVTRAVTDAEEDQSAETPRQASSRLEREELSGLLNPSRKVCRVLSVGYRNYRLDVMMGMKRRKLNYMSVVLDTGANLSVIR